MMIYIDANNFANGRYFLVSIIYSCSLRYFQKLTSREMRRMTLDFNDESLKSNDTTECPDDTTEITYDTILSNVSN